MLALLAACVTASVPSPSDGGSGGSDDTDRADTDAVDTDLPDTGTGPVAVTCRDDVTALDLDDPTPLGVTTQAIFDAAAEVTRADGAWSAAEGGAPTPVTVTLASAGGARLHDLVVATGRGGPRDCLDWLEIPATLHLDTAEGWLDETTPTTLRLELGALPSVEAMLDPLDLHGTLVLQSVDPGDWDATGLRVVARWTRTGLAGEVTVHATRDVGAGPETFDGPVLGWPAP
jgi:hypothetical protein